MAKRLRPDTRLSWRDPNMPVLRDYYMPNGEHRTVIDQDYERRFREHMLQTSKLPSYDDDPTYDLKKQRKRL